MIDSFTRASESVDELTLLEECIYLLLLLHKFTLTVLLQACSTRWRYGMYYLNIIRLKTAAQSHFLRTSLGNKYLKVHFVFNLM